MIFPSSHGGTRLVLDDEGERLPTVRWVGSGDVDVTVAVGRFPGVPLLLEHSRGSFLRPGLRGHRLADTPPVAGRD